MIAWVPELSVLVVMLPPVPRTPSRLEIQETGAARFPSSASVAVAVKVTGGPGSKLEPLAGAVVAACGVAVVVRGIVGRPVLPAVSGGGAGVGWVPAEGVVT